MNAETLDETTERKGGGISLKIKLLISKRLILRQVIPQDLNDLFEICSNPKVTEHMTWGTHNDNATTKSYIDYLINAYEKDDNYDWVIELCSEKKVVGICSFIDWSEVDKSAELGFVLSQNYWGKGIMKEAINELFKYGFRELGFNRIEGRCNDNNINSGRLMEKLDMKFEGILRKDRWVKNQYKSTKIYSILKEEYAI